jgi:hypothetical protein
MFKELVLVGTKIMLTYMSNVNVVKALELKYE